MTGQGTEISSTTNMDCKMKRVIYAAAFAACIFGCAKVESESPEIAGPVTAFSVSAPDTRTAIDGVHVLWTDCDSISLYGGAVYETSLTGPSSGAVFAGEGASQISGYYCAVYPAFAVSEWKSSSACVTLPSTQIANAGGFPEHSNLMWAKSTNSVMTFSHSVGYIKIEIDASSPSGIKCISVISRGSDNLSGTASIDCLDGSLSVTSGTPYVTLQNLDGSALSAGVYYIAVYPGTFSSGLTFRFLTDTQYADVDVAGPLSISEGQVQSVGKVKNLTFNSLPSIGTLYSEGSVGKGIFFYINGFDGLVVSLTESTGKMGADKTVKWNNNASKSGLANMALLQSLVTTDFATEFPLPYWAVNYGELGWFVGSNDETSKMFTEIKNTGFENFNSFLTSNGGTAFQDATYYWSSTVITSDDAKLTCKKITSSTGAIGSGNYAKDGNRPARAMKNVNFKTDKNL